GQGVSARTTRKARTNDGSPLSRESGQGARRISFMMKLLLTGFEPFGRFQRNPSGETAHHLHGMVLGGVQVTSQLLPVSFRRASAPLITALETVRPDMVLSL